jgi:hypothetical protein
MAPVLLWLLGVPISVIIPADAVRDTALRLRVIAASVPG